MTNSMPMAEPLISSRDVGLGPNASINFNSVEAFLPKAMLDQTGLVSEHDVTVHEDGSKSIIDVVVPVHARPPPQFHRKGLRRRQGQRRQDDGEDNGVVVNYGYDPWRDIYSAGTFQNWVKGEGASPDPSIHEVHTYSRKDYLYRDYDRENPESYEYDYYEVTEPDNDKWRDDSQKDQLKESETDPKRRVDHPFHRHKDHRPPPSLTRRIANAVFSPTSYALVSIIGVPLILAAAYWLFVVNGPTPVVRARLASSENPSDTPVNVVEAIFQALIADIERLKRIE